MFKTRTLHHLFIGFVLTLFLVSLPVCESFAQCAKPDCKAKACELADKMSTRNGKKALPNDCPSGKRYDVDPCCVMNKNVPSSGSCIDTMPVAQLNRVAETNCFRANGAGGNPTPRNHYGTDYAAVVGTPVTAAADGTIVQQRWASGGGRSVIIEHLRVCQCSAEDPGDKECSPKYHTVYYHLSAWAEGKSLGSVVKKGDVIGFVGGSNTHGGKNCDYPYKAEYKGDCYSYGPHLHFEIHHGPHAGGTNLKASMVDPLCDDIQTICGGCKTDYNSCLNKTNTNQWTQCSPEAKATKSVPNPPAGVATATGGSYDGGSGASAEVSSNRCDYHNFLLSDDDCLFCPLFKILYNAASSLALQTYKALKDGIVNVVIVAFALWIAWYVLGQIVSLEAKKPAEMMKEILVQTFRVLIVLIILQVAYGHILRLTISPVFDTASRYIQALMDSKCSPTAAYLDGLKGYETVIDNSSTGALPFSMGRGVLCSIKALQDGVWKMIAFGRECRCVGWHEKRVILDLLPNLSYVLSGDFLIIAGLLLLLAFPWCLVDCVLNMAIACALLPAAIGAWAFKITSKYLNTLWNFFMNAVFQFVFLSIILYIIVTLVGQFLQDIDQYAQDHDKLLDPINGFAFWSVKGLRLVLICLMGWVFLDNGKELAGKFADAPDLNIGRSTGAFFAQLGERIAIGGKQKDPKTGKMVHRGGILGIAKGTAGMAKMTGQHFIGTPAKRKINQLRSDWVKNKGTEIKDDTGKVIGYELNRSLFKGRNILGQKITRRVMLGEDGKMTYSKERETGRTQLKNWARGKLNEARVGLIQNQDERLMDKFNGSDLRDGESLATLADGTQVLKDSRGKIIASMKTNADGTRSISNTYGESVYDNQGNLLSAQKSFRNLFFFSKKGDMSFDAQGNLVSTQKPGLGRFLMGHKQTLSINRTGGTGAHSFDVKRSTTSLRNEALGAMAKPGSRLADVASSHAVKKERDLSSQVGKTQNVIKDHLVSIREVKNAEGEVIQQDIAFKPDVIKYLIDKQGRLNTQMIEQIRQGTQLSKEQINLAIANEILKDRNIKLGNKFFERKVTFEDGKLSVVQKNLDGSVTHLTTQTRGDQMLVVSNTFDEAGNITHIVDNGVMSRVVSKKANGEADASYGFSYQARAHSSVSNLINKHGQFTSSIDENEAMWGFEEYDRDLHAKQVETGRTQKFDTEHLNSSDESQNLVDASSIDLGDQRRRRSTPLDPTSAAREEQRRLDGEQLRSEIDKYNRQVRIRDKELEQVSAELRLSHISHQRRAELEKRRRELNDELALLHSSKSDLETRRDAFVAQGRNENV